MGEPTKEQEPEQPETQVENKKKDNKTRSDILELVEKSKISEELKQSIKKFIEELDNGDLEKLFNNLKANLKQNEENNLN